MKSTPRTWLLVLLALVVSGVIAWLEVSSRRAEARNQSVVETPPEEPDGSYTLDVELDE